MYNNSRFNIYINLYLVFHIFLFPFTICTFRDIKKISDNKDYLVILDSGFFIYNFEKAKCEKIHIFSQSPFEQDDNYNNFIISKNEISGSNEIKIAILINQHLYIYIYGNTNKNVENKILLSLVDSDHNIFPFYVRLINYKLIIYLMKYERRGISLIKKYYIKSYNYNYYSSMTNIEPEIIEYDDSFMRKMNCLYDIFNSLIKCVYVYTINSHLHFLTLEESGNSISEDDDIDLDGNAWVDFSSNYQIVSFSSSKYIDFICVSDEGNTKCFFKNNMSDGFNTISNNFENECSELKTFYFDEKDEFILSCKKYSNYYFYIFNAVNMNNNIQTKAFIINNYNGKYSLIYNNKINNYQFIYDGNFTKGCDEYNQEREVNFSTTSKILDNKESTYIFISDNIKTEDSTKIYKTEETIIKEIENSQILNENILSDSSIISDELTQKINETDLFFEDQNSGFLKKIT